MCGVDSYGQVQGIPPLGVHTSGVLDEQRENIKFLDRQRDYLAPHSDKALLQAEVQITFPDFRQGLVRRVLLFLKKGEGDINRNIASLIVTNKLRQFLFLIGIEQHEQLFANFSAGIF